LATSSSTLPWRNAQVSMTVEIADGWLRGIVEDDGAAAPVALDAVRMPEEMAVDGRGLAIAAQLLDEFTYERREERNLWRLGIALDS
jgi:anti-sigma regulatory factor (Ser/Thr protein kinase)